MTTARLVLLITALVNGFGCSDDKQSGFTASPSGGSAGSSNAAATMGGASTTGGTATAVGGAEITSSGGTTSSTATSSGGAVSVTTAVTRCTEATTGEVLLTHQASSGQPNSLVGATKITVGSLSSFKASDLDLKFCFSVVGSVALTSVAGMSVDSASISGGSVNYVNLSGTTRTLESTEEKNRYCIVFDVGSAAESSGVTVSGATAVTYNWRFNEKSVDVGLLFDPRAKNAPELKAVLNGKLAACQVVTS